MSYPKNHYALLRGACILASAIRNYYKQGLVSMKPQLGSNGKADRNLRCTCNR